MIDTIDRAGNRGWLMVLAGATSLALLALAGPVVAASSETSAGPGETVIVKVIKHRSGDQGADSKALSEGATVKMLENCGEGKKIETDTETKSDTGEIRRTRVVLCARDAKDGRSMVERLEATRKQMAEETNLTAAEREKVLATIDAEIARLKSPGSPAPYSRQ